MSNESKALATITPTSVEGFADLATRFAKSKLLPVDLQGKESDILVTLMAGQEMGLPPMAALRSIHVIKGKPILSADAMVAVVRGSGLARTFRRVEETDEKVTYETHRIGEPEPQRCTWTLAMAKRAALNGDNWRLFPRAMLAARAKSELCRDVYPDVLAGCYDEDEARRFAGTEPSSSPTAVRQVAQPASEPIDAEFTEEDPILAEINSASTIDALDLVASSVSKNLPDQRKKMLRDAFKARRAALQAQPAAEIEAA